eukprot:59998-Rhodomonas_salina.1
MSASASCTGHANGAHATNAGPGQSSEQAADLWRVERHVTQRGAAQMPRDLNSRGKNLASSPKRQTETQVWVQHTRASSLGMEQSKQPLREKSGTHP